MDSTLTRYAEAMPDPPRDRADFEAFIRELDAGRIALATAPGFAGRTDGGQRVALEFCG